jgi:hypothetical protein
MRTLTVSLSGSKDQRDGMPRAEEPPTLKHMFPSLFKEETRAGRGARRKAERSELNAGVC